MARNCTIKQYVKDRKKKNLKLFIKDDGRLIYWKTKTNNNKNKNIDNHSTTGSWLRTGTLIPETASGLLYIGLLVSEKKMFECFPIRAYVETMSADGGHLKFPISKKKKKTFCRGPSKDNACNVCYRSTYWFQKRTFLNIFFNKILC